MADHSNPITLENPGKLPTFPMLNLGLVLCVAIGLLAFGVGLNQQVERTWTSFTLNYFFFMCFAVGGVFFAALQYITNAMWSAPVRRLAEAFSSFLPVILVLFLVFSVFGLHHVYEWTHPEVMSRDPILAGKVSYLNEKFFVVRNVGALLLWIIFGRVMVGHSLKQDLSGDFRHTMKNRVFSALFIILFALTFTMASFDLLMSLDPHWFSTIFGVYCFAGLFYSLLALLCIVTIVLRRQGILAGVINDEHLHDIGKFMLTFTVFWAYIGFSQFMLIWYANLPEETGYYLLRFKGMWLPISVFLLLGKFCVPFFGLITRDAKRTESRLLFIAGFMLVSQWIDVMWMVQPQFHAQGPQVGWIELGTALGFIGLFGIVVLRFLSRHNVLAIKDPRLAEALRYHS